MPQERPRTAMRIMEEHSGGQMRPHRAGDQIEMDRKRQAHIAAKDEARKQTTDLHLVRTCCRDQLTPPTQEMTAVAERNGLLPMP